MRQTYRKIKSVSKSICSTVFISKYYYLIALQSLRSYATTYNSIYRLCARFKHLGRPNFRCYLHHARLAHTPFFPCHIRHHPVDGNTSYRCSPFRLEILRHIIQLKKNNPNSINRRKRVINNINHIHTDAQCVHIDKATRLHEFPRREHTADDIPFLQAFAIAICIFALTEQFDFMALCEPSIYAMATLCVPSPVSVYARSCICVAVPVSVQSSGTGYVYEYINYVPYRNNVIAAAKYKAYFLLLRYSSPRFPPIVLENSMSQTYRRELQGNTQFTYGRRSYYTLTHGYVCAKKATPQPQRPMTINVCVCVSDIISLSPFSTLRSAALVFISFSFLIKYV